MLSRGCRAKAKVEDGGDNRYDYLRDLGIGQNRDSRLVL